MAKICTVCGAPLKDGVKFCEFCGSPVPADPVPEPVTPEEPKAAFCPSCGAELAPGARFCPVCGHAVGGAPAAAATPEPVPAPAPTPAPAPAPAAQPVQQTYTPPAQPVQPAAQPQQTYTPPAQPVQQTYAPPAQPVQQTYAPPAQPGQPAAGQAAPKKKKFIVPIIAIAAAVVVALVLIGGFVWPGFFKGGAKADDPVLGTWKGVYTKLVGDTQTNAEEFSLDLKSGGKGVHHRDGTEFDVKWNLDGEDFTMSETFLGISIDYVGTLKDGVLDLYNGDPTDDWTYEYVYTRDGSMPAGSGAAGTDTTDVKGGDSNTTTAVTGGEVYDTGRFKVTAPEGWSFFPQHDVFSDDPDEMDDTVLYVAKGATDEWDLFSKPSVYIKYAGPRTTLWAPDKDFYDNAEDIEPFSTGSHNWNGFKGESIGSKLYILYEEQENNVQYQVTVYYDMSGGKIDINDADVQAILASIETTDPDAVSSEPEPDPANTDPEPTNDPEPDVSGSVLPSIDRQNVLPPEELEEFDWVNEADYPGEWVEMTDMSYLEGKWKVMHIYADEEDYIIAYDLCTIDFAQANGGLTGTYHWYKYIPIDSEAEDESDLNPSEFIGTMHDGSYYGVNDEIGTLAIHNFWVTSDAEYAAGYLTLENGTQIYVYLMRP